MAADISDFTAWSTTAASNQPDASDSIANLDDNLQKIQAEVRKYLATKGSDIASASTVNLATATGNYVHITGTTTITAFGTVSAGVRFLLVFDGALTLTHNATSLILPTSSNITTVAGDRCEVVSLGSGNWRCLWYQRASGAALAASGSYQPLDAELTAIAGLTSAANKVPYFTGSGTASLLDFKDEDNMASDSATAVPSQQSVKAYVDTSIAAIPDGLTLDTAVASTSGTVIDFTGIPSGTKRITINFSGVSTSGTSNPLIQIGDSGGFETTGYLGSGCIVQNAGGTVGATYTAGFGLPGSLAANLANGSITLTLINGAAFLWAASGVIGYSNGAFNVLVGGSKALSSELTQVRITTVNGTDTFDAGSINIMYE